MPTLILSPRHSAESHALFRAAIDLGWNVTRLPSWRVPDDFAAVEPALFGEWLFCSIVANALGVKLLEPPPDALPHLSKPFVKREVILATLGDARKRSGRRFLKPVLDKSFPARVYEGGADVPDIETWPDDLEVLIAEPVKWNAEFRCFVLEGEVVAFSPYLRNGELAWDPDTGWMTTDAERADALAFAASVISADQVSLPAAYVMDVGWIDQRGWAVVEFNPANGSGLYGCDPRAVLPVLARGSAG